MVGDAFEYVVKVGLWIETVVGVACECRPTREGVADRRSVGFARELCQRCFELEEQAIEERFRPGLPDHPADLWGDSSDLSFDGFGRDR